MSFNGHFAAHQDPFVLHKIKTNYFIQCSVAFRSPTAWGKELLCSLVVRQQILLCLFSGGIRVNTVWLLSFSIFGLCADISLHWYNWCSADGDASDVFWAKHQSCQLVMRRSWIWHWYWNFLSPWIVFLIVLSKYVVMPVEMPLKIRFATSTSGSECEQGSYMDWQGPRWSAHTHFCSVFASQQSNRSAMFLTGRSKLPSLLKTPKIRQNDSLVVCVPTQSCFSFCVKCQTYSNRWLQGLRNIPGWCLSAPFSGTWFNGQRENVGLSAWAELWGWSVLHRNTSCCFVAASRYVPGFRHLLSLIADVFGIKTLLQMLIFIFSKF